MVQEFFKTREGIEGEGERSVKMSGLILTASKKTVDLIFLGGYIPSMAWEVEYTDEFEAWWVESFLPSIPAERPSYLLAAERLAVRVGTNNTSHWLKEFMRNI